MAKMTWLERRYRRSRLDYVRHITIDPRGPGVVRIHMIPPHSQYPADPFLLLLNGAQLVPLNLSWAILLANFMDQLEPWSGREIGEQDWQSMLSAAVKATRRTYPGTGKAVLLGDLELMLRSIVAIARGQEPPAEVGALSLGEYAGRMSAPHRMDLMVSAMTRDGLWHCNQKCLHCYAAGQTLGETPELTTDQWRELLEKLRRANIPQVTFTGGEPTLRPDLPELVEAAQWFVTRLNTNGRLLTPELCRRLSEASLDSVQVTLYAARRDVHNALVGAEGFDDTVQGIRNAAAAGLIVSVNTPLCSLNRDYAETLRFVHGLGVRYVTCSGLIPTGSAAGEGDVLAAHRAKAASGAELCILAGTGGFTPAARRAAEWMEPPIRLIAGRQLALLFGQQHPATDAEIARRARRQRTPFSRGRIRALALAPAKQERYLLVAFLLALLYLFLRSLLSLVFALTAFVLAMLCARENRKAFRL